MEEIILDQPAIQKDKSNIKYSGFWQRFGAVVVDWLVLVPVTLGITYFNTSSWKNSVLLVLISIISTGYKPFMEYQYGATLGKMALKLRVRNLEFEEASLTEILLRNIFHIVPAVISLLFTLAMYSDSDFKSVSGLMEFGVFSQRYAWLQYINYAFGFIGIVDAIMLLADERNRSLHDRIGGTVVISEA